MKKSYNVTIKTRCFNNNKNKSDKKIIYASINIIKKKYNDFILTYQ